MTAAGKIIITREAIIRQGAADHPWVYSPAIARMCGPFLLKPWQQSYALIAASIIVARTTKRAVWLRRFAQYKGNDHHILNDFHTRLNLPSTTMPTDGLQMWISGILCLVVHRHHNYAQVPRADAKA
ncbi:hypothetical protein PROFUN_09636 [Planoprotostelium fungivorum]|uniref:Uncharacterized protein n=1 Tax=Planoprotostelium fungivorum TaxID=1890364 RepID=A0A2P6MP17_9EUKA|nr:hypothetical protein PROFUN_09636 [Planoprotostelium fungivorum]